MYVCIHHNVTPPFTRALEHTEVILLHQSRQYTPSVASKPPDDEHSVANYMSCVVTHSQRQVGGGGSPVARQQNLPFKGCQVEGPQLIGNNSATD